MRLSGVGERDIGFLWDASVDRRGSEVGCDYAVISFAVTVKYLSNRTKNDCEVERLML